MKKLAFLSAAALAFALQSASAQYTTNVLFTTSDDFSSWNNGWGSTTVAGSTAWDYDGGTVNGLGNSSNVGGTGTAGSLAVNSASAGWTLGALNYVGTAGYNFMQAFDPGYTSGYPGTTVAYSGTMQAVYTMPINEPASFGVELYYAYDASGWNDIQATSVTDLGASTAQDIYGNQQENYLATYNYTIAAGSMTYFNFGFIINTGTAPVSDWYIDNIVSLTPVPEPGTMALFGLGSLGFAFLARRRRA
jgi:hypothetical protein